jgi:ribosomal-protein-alanine N-acetyltransferase
MADRYRIRPADPGDVQALGQIERTSFGDPWTDRSLEEAVRSSHGMGLVAVQRAEVVGYLLARQVGGSGEILNLAVAPRARRKGVGRALLGRGLRDLAGVGVLEVFLEVRESNQAARALYEAEGFRVVGVRKGYYRSPLEDALVLRRELLPSA